MATATATTFNIYNSTSYTLTLSGGNSLLAGRRHNSYHVSIDAGGEAMVPDDISSDNEVVLTLWNSADNKVVAYIGLRYGWLAIGPRNLVDKRSWAKGEKTGPFRVICDRADIYIEESEGEENLTKAARD
jgi:hypothetical protein